MATTETRILRNYVLILIIEAACATNNLNQDLEVNISSANKMLCKKCVVFRLIVWMATLAEILLDAA